MILIKEIEKLQDFLQNGFDLSHCVLQDIDFCRIPINWETAIMENTYFLGCTLSTQSIETVINKGAYFFKKPPHLSYNPFRDKLYSVEELMAGYSPEIDNSLDKKIYDHFYRSRHNPDVAEALWQRIHDHAIDDALRELIQMDDLGLTGKKIVAVMGGHATPRTDENYKKIVLLSKKLSEQGYLVASGGGPGIMEATNLGGYLAGYSNYEAMEAIQILQKSPIYTDEGYLEAAQAVKQKFPSSNITLAIPTWFYGHEPSNLFSSHIAKYFSNSIREDVLLSIALHGVIFAPGSAGTFQEIFMDAAQNYYGTYRYISPMIFLDTDFYENQTFLYPVLRKIAAGRPFEKLLFAHDDIHEICTFIQKNKPKELR